MYKLCKNPLTHIFNASLSSGTFPDRLKLAKVIPLHKKGEHHDIKNYRLIFILSAFSKILEKLMYNRLMPFLIQNNIRT
jgi:potassium voltage-gated channel Eag-related subfamily H protein 8